jgi:hypothetical protein
MVPQGAWRRMFKEFKVNLKLRTLFTKIMNETDDRKLIELIDELYRENEGKQNYITGPSGNVVNAFLFLYNPSRYVSIVSLNDRKKVIETFNFNKGELNFDDKSTGKKFILSNNVILNGFESLGIDAPPRAVSSFLYMDLLPYWKLELEKMKDVSGEEVDVSIPIEEEVENAEQIKGSEKRDESIRIQAKLAEIGEALGLKIWLPIPDRVRVMRVWKPREGSLLEEKQAIFGFSDGATQKTIKNIDVLWVNKRSIVRAFEVEGTTAIYSGILRMADLLALQPNLFIRIHIVASGDKRDKVFEEINRPVFADINGKKLSDVCSYISYDSVLSLAGEKNLKNMKETVVDNYTEAPKISET